MVFRLIFFVFFSCRTSWKRLSTILGFLCDVTTRRSAYHANRFHRRLRFVFGRSNSKHAIVHGGEKSIGGAMQEKSGSNRKDESHEPRESSASHESRESTADDATLDGGALESHGAHEEIWAQNQSFLADFSNFDTTFVSNEYKQTNKQTIKQRHS
eukprot:TRINITY_DN7391_c0_g1_i1.p1 TRINITY_DN7391_c0_g1~~TRINITY_DN7391_c0_g1_i1.p1  ORF type:complete len:156 (-),score=24.68 TRINITY_DN7391_c0_g1_i1:26-493(-)